MQKTLLIVCFLLLITTTNAQFSFNTLTREPTGITKEDAERINNIRDQLNRIKGLEPVTSTETINQKELFKKIHDRINSIYENYHQKRMLILDNDTLTNKNELITILFKTRDSLIEEQKTIRQLIKHWDRYDRFEEIKQKKNFFPAYYSTQAIRFFEDNKTHLKLFQNNLINYNPKIEKMTLYTEAVNDYLGPFRVGVGFQIASKSEVDSLSTIDSTQKIEKKTNMLAAIQNGGGDISVNIKYPIIRSDGNSSLQYKFYFFANTAFSLPVLEKANADFLLNYNGGIEGALYAKGFNDRLTFYSQIRLAYYGGNTNYKQVITNVNKKDPTSFAIFETSFGLDFLDGYRLRVDWFHGNKFVKTNFPATITFIVRPGKN
jgi:hypothetical protein